MNDLISRQAAIDALEWKWAGKAAFDAIKNLPSAQPDDHHKLNIAEYIHDFYPDVWRHAEKELELPSAEPWIMDRLPDNDDWVIVTILDERGDTPFRYTDFGWYLDRATCWIVDAEQRTDVIAWMPLPQPYRKGDEA